MLRACRAVLKPASWLAFTTIELAPGLTRSERRRVTPAAPRAVGTRRPYPDLLDAAGFDEVGARDVTDDYAATTRAWLEHSLPLRHELEQVDGADAVAERLQGWADALRVIEAGWLRRSLYWARRDG